MEIYMIFYCVLCGHMILGCLCYEKVFEVLIYKADVLEPILFVKGLGVGLVSKPADQPDAS